MFRKLLCGLSLFIFIMMSPDVVFGVGAGGFRNEVVGAKGMGRGSANVAQTDDPAAVHYNPAAIVHLDSSCVSLGYTLEMPKTTCKTATGTEESMESQNFFIPNFYLVDDFGLDDITFGLGVTAPYGLGTDWSDDSFSKYVSTESYVGFYNINPTVAYQINDALSVGVGINYMSSDLDKYRKVNVSSVNTTLAGLGYPAATIESDGDFNLKADDGDAWGYNLGVLYKFAESHTLGLSYRSEVDFSYKGTVSMDGLGSGNTAALFGAAYHTDMETELTLPQSLAVGYAYRPSEKLTLELDVEWTAWSSVKQDLIEWSNETNALRLAILNADNPGSKDWDDVFSVGLGINYKATDMLELRCGYLFEETPVPEDSFDTPLPDADRHGITLGLGRAFKNGMTMDLSYMFLLFRNRDVTNNIGASSNADIDGRYEQFVNIFAVGFTYKY